MADDRGRSKAPLDFVALLRAAAATAPSGIQDWQDQNILDLRLSEFIRAYAGTPDAIGLEGRSSFREDSVVVELRQLLTANARDVTVIDMCCGEANVAKHIMNSIGSESRRVHILAVDGDSGCIEALQNASEQFNLLASFTPIVRMIPDVCVCRESKVDIIVLNNALHEVAPRYFAKMFANFNTLLNKQTGQVYVIDMSELPADTPESIAITWTGDEVCGVLRAGDLECERTAHDKSVPVYRIVIQPSRQGVNVEAIDRAVLGCLLQKQEVALERLRAIRRDKRGRHHGVQQWVVAVGTVARLADEIDFMCRSMRVTTD